MRWTLFICGLAIGAAGAFATMIYLQMRKPSEESDQLVFAPKSFYDSKQVGSDGLVAISGTLTGDSLASPNNTYAVACYQDRKECFVSSIEQIGHNQIGRIEAPSGYPIVKWDAFEVVAKEEFACAKITITIERKGESLLWVQEPVNQTRPNCKDADTKMHKYTIEDSPGWKRIFGKK